GDAGVEQVLAGQFQIGVAAAEQIREQRLEAGVDTIEGVLETYARFAVDLPDRVLQRFQRRGEVGHLRIEVFLALRGLGVFGNRGQVDRFQPRDARVDV